MAPKNIAICLAPTLIRINQENTPLSNISNKDFQSLASNQSKDLLKQKCDATVDCLTTMILNYRNIFQVPREALNKIESKHFEYDLPAKNRDRVEKARKQLLDRNALKLFLNEKIEENLKELKEKSRNWTSVGKNDSDVEIYYKKIEDGYPLRFWKLFIEIDAPAKDVYEKLLNER